MESVNPCFGKRYGRVDKPPLVYMNRNFAQKSATWKVWPLVLYEPKFCSKKCDMKSVTLSFIWTEILLKKVRHENCDPWFYMNWNFAQKSATRKVWLLVLYKSKFFSEKCNMKSVTLDFIWTEILLKKVRHEKCDPWFWKKAIVVTQLGKDLFILWF